MRRSGANAIWIAALVVAAAALTGCSQVAALAPVGGDHLTMVRFAAIDVLVDEGIDVLTAPVCSAEPGGATTEPGGATTASAATGDAAAGKQVFESAGCTACHTLADAGSTGTVGPNLDEAKPPASLVVDRVTNGKGAMPSFKGQLSETQIQDVAAYVSSAAGTS